MFHVTALYARFTLSQSIFIGFKAYLKSKLSSSFESFPSTNRIALPRQIRNEHKAKYNHHIIPFCTERVFTAAAVPTVSSISCSFTPVHLLIIHRHAVTCISSSLDWMSGGKSAAPQVKGSNGAAPNRSLPEEEKDNICSLHFTGH